MKRTFRVALLLAALTSNVVCGDLLAQSAIPCIPATSQHAKVVTSIPGATSARVYFRATQVADEYYVEMLRDETGAWWAPLPIPQPETKSAVYRIVSNSPTGQTSSDPVTVPVTSNCAPFPFAENQIPVTKNMVVGFVQDGTELKGWTCQDVAYRITPKDEMKRYEECKAAAFLTPAQNAAIAAAATAVGVIGVIVGHPEDNVNRPCPVSPVRPVPPRCRPN